MRVRKELNVAIVVVAMLCVLALAVLVFVPAANPYAQAAQPTPTPTPDYSVTLEYGTEFTAISAFEYSAAQSDECTTDPMILDVRAADDPSLSLLPRLGAEDYQQAKAFFGFKELDTYGCSKAAVGQKYWDLAAIEVKCGPAVLQPQFFSLDGTVHDNSVLAFLNWPGAETFPTAVDPPYAQRGVAGFSSVSPENNSLGWGYGGESHIGDDGGPYLVWPSSDPANWADRIIGSDALDDVGWFDNHCTPNPMFRIARKEGAVPPPDGEGYELINYDADGNEIGRIPFSTDVKPVNVAVLGLRLDGLDIGWLEWLTD
jgi:hypothetical protein